MMKSFDIDIGGITPFSTIDFPDKLAVVVYTQGCNFRCLYCHNYRLIEGKEARLSLASLESFLDSRKRILDGVVISGGEPTLHKGLPAFCQWIKKMGFEVKLDTNGTNPLMLQVLIKKKLIDFVAMDIKAPWDKYAKIIGRSFDTGIIKESLQIIKRSGLPCEFRTTVHSALLSKEDLTDIAHIVGYGYPLTFQICNPTPLFNHPNKYTSQELKEFAEELKRLSTSPLPEIRVR